VPGILARHHAVGVGFGLGAEIGSGEGRTGALAEGPAQDHAFFRNHSSSRSSSLRPSEMPSGLTEARVLAVRDRNDASEIGAPVVQLVREELIMGLHEYQQERRKAVIVRMYVRWLSYGFATWRRFSMRLRGLERALVSAYRI